LENDLSALATETGKDAINRFGKIYTKEFSVIYCKI
jgi:hypothetical protein